MNRFIVSNNSLFSSASDILKKKMFQNWGDYSDMSQSVAIYIVLAVDVLLLCWFGTQLAQHVRKTGLFLYLKCYEHYAYGDIHSSP